MSIENENPASCQTAVSGSALLRIWIIRNSAFSIQCGGLERLFVCFTKPVYVFSKPMTSKQRDTPFGDILESEGLYDKYGWIEPSEKTWVKRVSVGNWIGYENEVSEYIWEKLKEHFHYEPFENWHILEKEGKSNIEDFLLELQVSVSLS
jgi:hypothetical protein